MRAGIPSFLLFNDQKVFDITLKILAKLQKEICIDPLKFIPAISVEIASWEIQIFADLIFTDLIFSK